MEGVSKKRPIFPYDEVIGHCRDLFGLQISEEELRRPTPQFVKKFYLEAVTKILQIPPEQMTQPHFQLLSEFQYPELAEEAAPLIFFTQLLNQAAPLIFFTQLLQRFMYGCTVNDFSKNDLLHPKPKRTLACISAVINFAMFKRSQDYLFENAMAEKEGLTTQNNILRARNQELRNQITEIKAARAEDEERVQQILPEVENLERIVYDFNRQQAEESREIQRLKTEIAERASKEAEIKATIANDKDEIEKLKTQIVTSPDKFRAEISRLNSSIYSNKTAIAEKTQRVQGLKNQLDSINLLEEDAGQAVKLIASLKEETEKLRTNQKKVQDLRDTVSNDEEVLKEKTGKMQNLKRQRASQSEKLTRLVTKNDKKVSSTTFAIKQAEKDQGLCRNKLKDAQEEIMEIEMECQKIRKAINDKENCHYGTMEETKDIYQQLLNQLDVYHSSLEKGWDLLATSLSE